MGALGWFEAASEVARHLIAGLYKPNYRHAMSWNRQSEGTPYEPGQL